MKRERPTIPGKSHAHCRVEQGQRIWVGGHNARAKTLLDTFVEPGLRTSTDSIEQAFIVANSLDEAIHFAETLALRLGVHGIVWLVEFADESEARFSAREVHQRMETLGYVLLDQVEIGDSLQACRFVLDPSNRRANKSQPT